VFANAGFDQNGCLSQTTLAASLVGYEPQGLWTASVGGITFADASLPTSQAFGFANGSTVLTWTVQNASCQASDEVVMNNFGPASPVLGPDQVLCTDQVSIDPGTAGVVWSLEPQGGTVALEGQVARFLLPVGQTTITATTQVNGCTASASVVMDVLEVSPFAGNDTVVIGQRALLSGNVPQNGSFAYWTVATPGVNASFDNILAAATGVVVDTHGTVLFRRNFDINQGGCGTSFDEVAVVFGIPTDYGDLPSSYGATLISEGGAAHRLDGLSLGLLVDAEMDGQPHALAVGDDLAGLADDDGVVSLDIWPLNDPEGGRFDVEASGPGCLSVWLDWNRDGAMDPANELVVDRQAVVQGMNPVLFDVPDMEFELSAIYDFNTRFRLMPDTDNDGCANETLGLGGLVEGGEVEDYVVYATIYYYTTWDGTEWSYGEPDSDTYILLDGDLQFVGQVYGIGMTVLPQINAGVGPGAKLNLVGLQDVGKAMRVRVMRIR